MSSKKPSELARLREEVKHLKEKAGLSELDGVQKRLLAFAKDKKNSGTWALAQLSRKFGAAVPVIEEAIGNLRREGYEIQVDSGVVEYLQTAPPGVLTTHFWRLKEGGWLRFGVLGDTHLGNRCQRLDVLNTAYDHFAAEGIDTLRRKGSPPTSLLVNVTRVGGQSQSASMSAA
jgi:hypothetical protein